MIKNEMGKVTETVALFPTIALCAIVVAGCRESVPKFPCATLQGQISVDGAAVQNGRVNFMPKSGTPGWPISADIEAGRYVAETVPLGELIVTFSITSKTGKMIAEGDRQPYPEVVSIVPLEYAKGIPLNVTGDNVAQDFLLVNKHRP